MSKRKSRSKPPASDIQAGRIEWNTPEVLTEHVTPTEPLLLSVLHDLQDSVTGDQGVDCRSRRKVKSVIKHNEKTRHIHYRMNDNEFLYRWNGCWYPIGLDLGLVEVPKELIKKMPTKQRPLVLPDGRVVVRWHMKNNPLVQNGFYRLDLNRGEEELYDAML